MTKANITINKECFHVSHDGMDGDELKEVIQGYVNTAKEKLKNPNDIAEWVLNALYKDADDYYNWIQVGDTDFASHNYEATIDEETGELTFKEMKKVKKDVG